MPEEAPIEINSMAKNTHTQVNGVHPSTCVNLISCSFGLVSTILLDIGRLGISGVPGSIVTHEMLFWVFISVFRPKLSSRLLIKLWACGGGIE